MSGVWQVPAAVLRVVQQQAPKAAPAPARAGNGTSIDQLTQTILDNYDHDRSGTIDITADGAELQRVEHHQDANGGYWAVMSGERFLRRADTDGDGHVTATEVQALLSAYDTGNFLAPQDARDGALDALEAIRALGEVGEQVKFFLGAGAKDGAGLVLGGTPQGGFVGAGNAQGGFVAGGNQQAGGAIWNNQGSWGSTQWPGAGA